MKPLNEIQVELRPLLQDIETFRAEKIAQVQRNQNLYLIPLALATVTAISFFANTFIVGAVAGLLLVPSTVLIYLNKISPHEHELKRVYKQKIISSLLQQFGNTIDYQCNAQISKDSFIASGFFPSRSYSSVSGTDYFRGRLDTDCQFEYSALTILDDLESMHITFEGYLFAIKTVHQNNPNLISILSNKQANKLKPKTLKRVRIENDLFFDSKFVVYTQNESDALTFLSEKMLNLIGNIQQEWNAPLSITMIDDMIYIAIESPSNLFDIQPKSTPLSDDALEDLYENLQLCFNTIEHFSNLEKIPKKYNMRNWANTAYDHFQENDKDAPL